MMDKKLKTQINWLKKFYCLAVLSLVLWQMPFTVRAVVNQPQLITQLVVLGGNNRAEQISDKISQRYGKD